MKQESQFFDYLVERYKSDKTGKPLSKKAAMDSRARCRRVEELLKTELSRSNLGSDAAFEQMRQRLIRHPLLSPGKASGMRYPYQPYVAAIRAYRRFLAST